MDTSALDCLGSSVRTLFVSVTIPERERERDKEFGERERKRRRENLEGETDGNRIVSDDRRK